MPGSAYGGDLVGRQTQLLGGRLRERGHGPRVAQSEGALEVDEVADRGQQVVEARVGPAGSRRRAAIDSARSHGSSPAAGNSSSAIGREGVDDGRVEVAAAPAAGHRDRTAARRTSGGAPRPRRRAGPPASRSGCRPGGAGRQPPAVVAFEGVGQRPLDVRAEAEVPRQCGRRGAVGVDQRRRAGRGRPASAWPCTRTRCGSGSPRATLPSRNRR